MSRYEKLPVSLDLSAAGDSVAGRDLAASPGASLVFRLK